MLCLLFPIVHIHYIHNSISPHLILELLLNNFGFRFVGMLHLLLLIHIHLLMLFLLIFCLLLLLLFFLFLLLLFFLLFLLLLLFFHFLFDLFVLLIPDFISIPPIFIFIQNKYRVFTRMTRLFYEAFLDQGRKSVRSASWATTPFCKLYYNNLLVYYVYIITYNATLYKPV